MDKLKATLPKLGESDLAFIISEMERKIERNSETNCDSDDSESYFHEEFQEIEQQWNYPIKLRRMYRKIYNEEIRLEFQKKPKNITLVGTESMNLSVHLMVRTPFVAHKAIFFRIIKFQSTHNFCSKKEIESKSGSSSFHILTEKKI